MKVAMIGCGKLGLPCAEEIYNILDKPFKEFI